jgi:hypothetical protein
MCLRALHLDANLRRCVRPQHSPWGEEFDGRLSKALGFKEAFHVHREQYQNSGAGGCLWLFPPGLPGTEYETARRKVVALLQRQLLRTGDWLDARVAELLCDDALIELNGRRHQIEDCRPAGQ